MGMFDYYEPEAKLRCPACNKTLWEWQGKDGRNGLLVWRQGIAAPVDQQADDANLDAEDREKLRLPETFEIHSYDCGCPFPVEARCRSIDGVWTETELITADNATQRPREGAWQFRARLRWLRRGS